MAIALDNINKKYDFMVVNIINSDIILNLYKYNDKYIYNFNVIHIFRNMYYILLIIIQNIIYFS